MNGRARERLRVQRVSVVLDGCRRTLLSPRPSEQALFATNRYHETWHVLSDVAGAQLLGRLCWAMAFQKRPGTLFVIGQRFLVPNPFDADPSSPIVIHNTALGGLSRQAIAALRSLASATPSDGRVALQTPGLDLALGDQDSFWLNEQQVYWRSRKHRSWIDRVNGSLVMAAEPAVLRAWGVSLSLLGQRFWRGSDYAELDWPAGTGEIQIFDDFSVRVAQAITARQRRFPHRDHQELFPEERQELWHITAAGRPAAT